MHSKVFLAAVAFCAVASSGVAANELNSDSIALQARAIQQLDRLPEIYRRALLTDLIDAHANGDLERRSPNYHPGQHHEHDGADTHYGGGGSHGNDPHGSGSHEGDHHGSGSHEGDHNGGHGGSGQHTPGHTGGEHGGSYGGGHSSGHHPYRRSLVDEAEFDDKHLQRRTRIGDAWRAMRQSHHEHEIHKAERDLAKHQAALAKAQAVANAHNMPAGGAGGMGGGGMGGGGMGGDPNAGMMRRSFDDDEAEQLDARSFDDILEDNDLERRGWWDKYKLARAQHDVRHDQHKMEKHQRKLDKANAIANAHNMPTGGGGGMGGAGMGGGGMGGDPSGGMGGDPNAGMMRRSFDDDDAEQLDARSFDDYEAEDLDARSFDDYEAEDLDARSFDDYE